MDTILPTSLAGLFRIQRPTHIDDRGFFREPFRLSELEKFADIEFKVAQMNHAKSAKNTLRGIHVAPWNKLIYVTSGEVQSVIVDLRNNSSTFGKYESFIIGDSNKSSIFIPKGFGNSYLVLSEEADYVYLTDQEWEPNKEFGVMWNDPDIAVDWKVKEPTLSEKDRQNPSFKSLFPAKF